MSRIVECVPNFSEGRKKEVVDAISDAISSTQGCSLLDVDPGASTNRTVYTFVGSPEDVVDGAINAAKVAFRLIDMSKHKGEHPRMGAMDVCPFIPIEGVTMDDCVTCAHKFAEKLSAELDVPSYLYGFASNQEYRKSIPQIRTGEYEDLAEKLKKSNWEPDYGPSKFVPRWGATLVGARNFLIAYNVNLISTKEQAHRIALDIREQGRGGGQPGKLKCVQAIGWYLDEANLAQVSVNITDIEVTGVHQVFEEVLACAKDLKLAVVGSQVVGLVPLKAITRAADYYAKKEELFILEEDQKIRLAIERMGLSSVGVFNPRERIIEFMVQKDSTSSLLSLSVNDFVKSVSERTPAPGGGSVAALVASLGAGLSTMAGFLTYGNKKFAHLDAPMRELLPPLFRKTKSLSLIVEADSKAFNDYMAAMKLPKGTNDELEKRNREMEKALNNAISVPMEMIRSVNEIWPVVKELSRIANSACLSDLQVGVRSLEAAAWGGHYNVLANIKQIKDSDKVTKLLNQSTHELKMACESAEEILKILDERYNNE